MWSQNHSSSRYINYSKIITQAEFHIGKRFFELWKLHFLSTIDTGACNIDTQWNLFSSKFQTIVLGQTIWADNFWGFWGIFLADLSAIILVPTCWRNCNSPAPFPSWKFLTDAHEHWINQLNILNQINKTFDPQCSALRIWLLLPWLPLWKFPVPVGAIATAFRN